MENDRKRQKTVPTGLYLDYSSSSEDEEDVNDKKNDPKQIEKDTTTSTNTYAEIKETPGTSETKEESLSGENETHYDDDDDEEEEEEEDNGLNLSDLESDDATGDSDADTDNNNDNDGILQSEGENIEASEKYPKYSKTSSEWIFLKMLDTLEPKISPFSTYDLEISSFIETPQFFEIEDDNLKRELFNYWCSINGNDNKESRESEEQEIGSEETDDDEENGELIELVNYLKENQYKLPKYYFDFKRKFKKDLKDLEIYKDNSNQRLIESIYKKFISFQRLGDNELIKFYLDLLIPRINSYLKLNLQIKELEKISNVEEGFKMFKSIQKLGLPLQDEFVEFLFLDNSQIMKEIMLCLIEKLTNN